MKRLILVGAALTFAVAALLLSGAWFSATPTAMASLVAGISGPGSSGVQVQNLNATITANISSAFYPQGGGAPVLVTRQIAPDSSSLLYLPSISTIPNGAYAVVVSSDQPVGAIARTEWSTSLGAASYTSVAPSANVRLALVTKTYVNQTSRFIVQNADTGAVANIRVRVFARGSSVATLDFTDTLPAGNSKTYDMATNAGVPDNFLGSALIESTNGKMLVVASFVDFPGTKAVTAFSGVDAGAAATTLYAPIVRRNYPAKPAGNGPTTGISVVNVNAVTVTVTANFYPSPGKGYATPAPQIKDIGPNSSAVFYQGSGIPSPWVGSAVLNSVGGPVLAVVNDRDDSSGTSGAYNVPSAAEGARTVSIPLVRRKNTSNQLTTGINCMNIGTGGVTTMTVSFRNSAGVAVGDWTQGSIGQYVAPTFYEASASSPMAPGSYGSAKVTSTNENIVCIVNDASDIGTYDAAVFNGIPIP